MVVTVIPMYRTGSCDIEYASTDSHFRDLVRGVGLCSELFQVEALMGQSYCGPSSLPSACRASGQVWSASLKSWPTLTVKGVSPQGILTPLAMVIVVGEFLSF